MYIVGLGETGFELPKSNEIKFVDPEIIPLDVDVSCHAGKYRTPVVAYNQFSQIPLCDSVSY